LDRVQVEPEKAFRNPVAVAVVFSSYLFFSPGVCRYEKLRNVRDSLCGLILFFRFSLRVSLLIREVTVRSILEISYLPYESFTLVGFLFLYLSVSGLDSFSLVSERCGFHFRSVFQRSLHHNRQTGHCWSNLR
jgi:hypothetical protein